MHGTTFSGCKLETLLETNIVKSRRAFIKGNDHDLQSVMNLI